MNRSRRRFLFFLSALAAAPLAAAATAGVDSEVLESWRSRLARSAQAAIARLGRLNGYFADAQHKIGLPKNFTKAERFLRLFGKGQQVDDLVLAMNRTAEAAVAQLGEVVSEAVRTLRVANADVLLSVSDDAAITWFREQTQAWLGEKMAPIIHRLAEPCDLARAYAALSSTLVSLAGIKSDLATVENYVNRKALDGFYGLLAAEVRARRAPAMHAASVVTGKAARPMY